MTAVSCLRISSETAWLITDEGERETVKPASQFLPWCFKGEGYQNSNSKVFMNLNIRKYFFSVWVTEHCTGFPKRLLSFHPCRCSKAAWTATWATEFQWLCLSRSGVKQMISRGSFHPQPFQDSVICLFSPLNLSIFPKAKCII